MFKKIVYMVKIIIAISSLLFALVGCSSAPKSELFDQCHAAGSFQLDHTATPMFCISEDDSEGCIKPAINSGFRRDLKAQLCSTTL